MKTFFVLISFIFCVDLFHLISLFPVQDDADEPLVRRGDPDGISEVHFYPLFYTWGVSLTKQTFTFYCICICNGFVFALIFLQAKWIPTDWLSAVFPEQCGENRCTRLCSNTAGFFFWKLYLYPLKGWRSSRFWFSILHAIKVSFPGYSLLSENNKGGDRVQDGNWQVRQKLEMYSNISKVKFLGVKLFH